MRRHGKPALYRREIVHLYGLAASGETGVARALEIPAEELRRDMALLGVRSLDAIYSSFIRSP